MINSTPPFVFHNTSNGRQPPDWRYRTAVGIAKLPMYDRKQFLTAKGRWYKTIDQPTREIVDFLVAEKGDIATTPLSPHELAEKFPHLYEARQIHLQEGEGTDQRWMIEALIVAQESVENIAAYMAIEAETIRAYEQAFFDVRKMLDHEGYLKTMVIPAPAVGKS